MVGIGGKMMGKWWDSVGFDRDNPLSKKRFSVENHLYVNFPSSHV